MKAKPIADILNEFVPNTQIKRAAKNKTASFEDVVQGINASNEVHSTSIQDNSIQIRTRAENVYTLRADPGGTYTLINDEGAEIVEFDAATTAEDVIMMVKGGMLRIARNVGDHIGDLYDPKTGDVQGGKIVEVYDSSTEAMNDPRLGDVDLSSFQQYSNPDDQWYVIELDDGSFIPMPDTALRMGEYGKGAAKVAQRINREDSEQRIKYWIDGSGNEIAPGDPKDFYLAVWHSDAMDLMVVAIRSGDEHSASVAAEYFLETKEFFGTDEEERVIEADLPEAIFSPREQ